MRVIVLVVICVCDWLPGWSSSIGIKLVIDDRGEVLSIVMCMFALSLDLSFGQILTCHILAPPSSRGPCNMRVLVLSCTIIPVLVKVTVHPASQNFPILIRLFVKVGMMCPSAVPMGRLGESSLADAADCSN